jgi:hypothetical protein
MTDRLTGHSELCSSNRPTIVFPSFTITSRSRPKYSVRSNMSGAPRNAPTIITSHRRAQLKQTLQHRHWFLYNSLCKLASIPSHNWNTVLTRAFMSLPIGQWCRHKSTDLYEIRYERHADSVSTLKFLSPVKPACRKGRDKNCNNNSVALVRERTIPKERPLLVDEVVPTSAVSGCHVVSVADSYGRILGFLDPQPLFRSGEKTYFFPTAIRTQTYRPCNP